MSLYAVTNPATGEIEKRFPQSTDEEIQGAAAAAEHAHRNWSRKSALADRSALVKKVAQLHRERREELARIICREMGKPIASALGEVDFAADIYEYYAANCGKFLEDEPVACSGAGSAFVRRSSMGVILGIMPWNYPYYQVARFAGPNLLIGNTVLLKHAPQCPESAAAMQQIYLDAGFPAGAYNNIYASNEQVATLIADPRVQGVSLTGSERAGAAVAEIAGRHLKKCVLELGGSDPFLLLSTDNLDEAVEAAVGARMENAGQCCNAAKRIIVMDGLYDAFLSKFAAEMTAKKVGDPMSLDTTLGPLSSLAATERIEQQVKSACEQGARVVARGDGERKGCFFQPVVLADVKPSNSVHREEFFGPVAVVYRVKDEDEAVDLANDTSFGLGSYVFTTDKQQALRVADKIDAGMVFVNGVGLDSPELPFGGVKRSGFGRELGRFGIEEFANRKLIRIKQ